MRLRCARRTAASLALAAAAGGLALAASGCAREEGVELTPRERRLVSGGISDGALQQIANQLDPAARHLAERHDPWLRRKDFWGRPTGWETFETREIPDIGLGYLDGPDAVQVNALKPFAPLPIRPMRPFVLKAAAGDRERALRCLAQAVYYESAREPLKGQEAVAQVVLNRVRHPAFPASVCGVVFQGSERTTGCQFSFACDGSMARQPSRSGWARAGRYAADALSGQVFAPVGLATHYHTYAVTPSWNRSIVMTAAIGAHFFHRWKGWWGTAAAFRQVYAGGEPMPGPHAPLATVPAPARPLVIAAASPVLPAPVTPLAEVKTAYQNSGTPVIAPAAGTRTPPGTTADRLPAASTIRPEYADSGTMR